MRAVSSVTLEEEEARMRVEAEARRAANRHRSDAAHAVAEGRAQALPSDNVGAGIGD